MDGLRINFKKAVSDALDGVTVDEAVASEIAALFASHHEANAKARARLGAAFKPVLHNEAQVTALATRVFEASGLFDIVAKAMTDETVRAAQVYARRLTAKLGK